MYIDDRDSSTHATYAMHDANAEALAAELFRRANELSAEQRTAIVDKINKELTPKQERYVEEFVVDLNKKRAAHAAGLSAPPNNVHVDLAVRERLDEYNVKCELNAEYTREYILDTLELCPTDYFQVAPNGDMVIDLEEFNKLPHRVKRQVEGIDIVVIGGHKYYKVRFVSKGAAINLAARYTLTQKVAAAVVTVPWDMIQGASPLAHEHMEARINAEGPPGAGSEALATCEVLQYPGGDNSQRGA